MADEDPDPTPTRVIYRMPSDEYRFVTGVVVSTGKMVYLDFAQHDAHEEHDDALGIVRLVMHPDMAADLVEKLSELQSTD